MYIFYNAVINKLLLLSVLIFIATVQQVIAAHHRIIIKDSLPVKENKHKSPYIPKIKKPDSFNFQKDEFLPVTTEDYYETINTNNRNNHFVDKIKRFKPRTTTPRATNFADLIEFTTQFSQKLSVPKYESSFDQYHTRRNNSLDLPAASSYNQLSSINFNKLFLSKDEFVNYRKNYSIPYEVHEEIQEDSNSTSPTLYNSTKVTNIYYNHKYT